MWRVIDIDRAPAEPGCYAVYLKGELVYIGQSVNVKTRLWGGHGISYYAYSNCLKTPWGHSARFTFKFRAAKSKGEHLMAEHRLIHRLKPRFNVRGTRRK